METGPVCVFLSSAEEWIVRGYLQIAVVLQTRNDKIVQKVFLPLGKSVVMVTIRKMMGVLLEGRFPRSKVVATQ